jgi:hypothetical protein
MFPQAKMAIIGMFFQALRALMVIIGTFFQT